MKRKSDELYLDLTNARVAKKAKFTQSDWVSGTAVKNYILGEPVLDWFNMYYDKSSKKNILKEHKQQKSQFGYIQPFMQRGLIFERQVYEDLKKRFPDDCKEVYNQYTDGEINEINFNKTKEAMNNGVPIIMQAVVMDDLLKIRGVADLIVRSDYLDKIYVKHTELDTDLPEHITKKGYYYVIIDIKHSHLTLCSKNNLIRNTGRMKCYKSQLLIYNVIIGKIQEYTPKKTYIMGKSWNIDSKVDPDSGTNCYDILGVIDYETFDNKYVKLTKSGIDWVRNLRKNGESWSPLKPHIKEMCCNLSNTDDEPWSSVKKQVLEQTKDLTCIWNIGSRVRDYAFDRNIKSYDQPECTVENIGLKPSKITDIIRQILQVNKKTEPAKILPKKIKTKKNKWYKKYSNEFYIDFETFCDIPDEVDFKQTKNNGVYLFMIGVGFEKNGSWVYKCFKCRDKTVLEERRILKKFKKYIDKNCKKTKKPTRLIHWSPAEQTTLDRVLDRHQKLLKMWWDDVMWLDLCDLFKSEPITIKGATNFKLKTIASNMYKHGMIKTKYNDEGIKDGRLAAFMAQEYYKNKDDNNIMTDIISYNEIDCKVLWDILKFLRKYRK
jgi:predicted RecB family nuclease